MVRKVFALLPQGKYFVCKNDVEFVAYHWFLHQLNWFEKLANDKHYLGPILVNFDLCGKMSYISKDWQLLKLIMRNEKPWTRSSWSLSLPQGIDGLHLHQLSNICN